MVAKGHRQPLAHRFWSKVDIRSESECWLWTAGRRGRYGQFWLEDRLMGAHQVSYLLTRGFLTPSLVVDHVCKNTLCVNPEHLREVTQKVNVLASDGVTATLSRNNVCQNGHPLNEENSYVRPDTGHRRCRICRAAYKREWRKRSNP